MLCTDLVKSDHLIVQLIQKAGFRHKTGLARISVQGVADRARVPRSEIRARLRDLEAEGFLGYHERAHDRDTDRISMGERGETPCTCLAAGDALALPVGSPAAHPGASGSGAGGWEGGSSPGAEGPYAHDVRESRSFRLTDRALEKARRGEKLSANDLALIFGERARLSLDLRFVPPGIAHHKALATNFARWMREGTSYELIHAMILVFFADSRVSQKIKDLAWKEFIRRRSELAANARRRLEVMETESGADMGWGEIVVDSDFDADGNLRPDRDDGWGAYYPGDRAVLSSSDSEQ